MLVGPQTKLRAGAFTGEQPSYPTTSAAFAASTGITPTSLYTCLGASGTLVDVVGGNNLAVTGTPRFNQQIGGSVGVNYNLAGAVGHSANVNDPGLSSCMFGAIGIWMGSGPAASFPGIIGRITVGLIPEIALYKASDTLNYPRVDIKGATTGSLSLFDTNINVVTPRRPVLYIVQIDRTNTTARLIVADSMKLLTNQSGSIATHDTYSGGASPLFYVASGTGITLRGGLGLSLAFYATGAQCEGASTPLNIAKRLGFGE